MADIIPSVVTGMCGDVIKAVYLNSPRDIKLFYNAPWFWSFKLEDGRDIPVSARTGDTYTEFDRGTYTNFTSMGYGDGAEVTVYIKPLYKEDDMPSFYFTEDLLELYVPNTYRRFLGDTELYGASHLRKLVLGNNPEFHLRYTLGDGSMTYYKTPIIIFYSNVAPNTTFGPHGPEYELPEGTNGIIYYPAGAEESYNALVTQFSQGRGWSAETFSSPTFDCTAPTPFDSGSTSGDTSGSTSGDTSGSTSGDTSGETVAATGSCIEITYDTSKNNKQYSTAWPSGTKLLGRVGAITDDYSSIINTSWIHHAELEDGTTIPWSQLQTGYYQFSGIEPRYFTVRYYPKTSTLPDKSFYECGRVVSAKIVYVENSSYPNIITLGELVFGDTSLSCITLPEGFRRFGVAVAGASSTFNYAPLACITIPASMSEPMSDIIPNMGYSTFQNSGIKKIFAKGMTAPAIASTTFNGISRDGMLYYPVGADYSEWIKVLSGNGWSWAAYNPFNAETCDCMHDGENVEIVNSGATVGSGSTSHTITYSGCPLVFDHSASTGTWNTLPTVTTGGTTDNWTITYDVPENDTDSARTITYYYLRYSGETCEDFVETVSYTISQSAGSGSSGETTYAYVDPEHIDVSSNAGVVEYNVYAVNCTFTGAGLTLSSSSITGDWSSGPAYVEHVKISNTHMIVRVAYPKNTGTYRSIDFNYDALTDCGQQGIHFIFGQNEYTPSPGEVSATSITLNVDSAITGSGIATTTVIPSDAIVNLRYTSSNSTIATIDQNGRITVVRNGQITICVKDLITGLQDCKTIRVTKRSTPGGDDDDLIYVYTGITVNDNEGHRYNITAEPGFKYGCLGKTYKTISACEARYSLYYINAYGGVDVLPCKGKSSMKKDNITRYNYSRTFRNNTLEFENTNYLSEIKATWELHTGFMVDTQSEKMHHLVESTCVFLYDAMEQTYTPVVMTDKTLEYKTFHNQGRTFYNYTINIEESQSRERR